MRGREQRRKVGPDLAHPLEGLEDRVVILGEEHRPG